MDVHLTDLLREYGIRREAATRRGWGGLTNGELVEAATKAGFTCILPRDRLFADSVGRMLDEHSNFSIVVVHPDLLSQGLSTERSSRQRYKLVQVVRHQVSTANHKAVIFRISLSSAVVPRRSPYPVLAPADVDP